MSPRGYFTKEYINPYFTSEVYIDSPEHDHAIEYVYTMDNRLRSIVKYPRNYVKKVYYRFLSWLGYLKKPQ
jgi:hypothetical protein